MSNKKIALVVIAVVLFLGGIGFFFDKATPIDWSPTFINIQKNPYDTYISYKLLEDVFPNGEITSTRQYPYNNLDDADYYYEDDFFETKSDSLTSYIFINRTFTVDALDLDVLLDLAYYGGNVFISAESFSSKLLDSLFLKSSSSSYSFLTNDSDTLFQLTDYIDKKYHFKSISEKTSLFIKDKSPYTYRVLEQGIRKEITFIQVDYGNGHFYLHTHPIAYTNVSMLDSTQYEYAFRCLSYLPKGSDVIWDESQKKYPFDYRDTNILKVIMRYKELLSAITLALIGLFLFMLFKSKRTQRIIPIVNPPKNSSLEFLETIGNLYYIKGDKKSITEYRYNFFLDILRKQYYLRTEHIDDELIKTIAIKSNVDIITVENIFELYRKITKGEDTSNQTFLLFNDAIEKFYKISSENKVIKKHI